MQYISFYKHIVMILFIGMLYSTQKEINFYADISKLSSLTNWAPKFKIIDGIQKILNEV